MFWSLAGVTVAKTASAQVAPQQQQQQRYNIASVYRYADNDDVTIRVSIWGAIRNTGIYEIRRGTRLNELFSVAGGPEINVSRRADDQTIKLTLVRETENGRKVVYEETMDEEITVGDENPVLEEGDVLTVESYIQQGVNWRDVLSIGSSLVTLGITILNFATR